MVLRKYLKTVSGGIGSSNSLVFGQGVEEVRKVQEKGEKRGPIHDYLTEKAKVAKNAVENGVPRTLKHFKEIGF